MPRYPSNINPVGYAPTPYAKAPGKGFSPALLNAEFKQEFMEIRQELIDTFITSKEQPPNLAELQVIEDTCLLRLRNSYLNIKFFNDQSNEFDDRCYNAHVNAIARNLSLLGLIRRSPKEIPIKYKRIDKPKKKQPLAISDILNTKPKPEPEPEPKPEPEPIPDNKPTLTVSQLLYRRRPLEVPSDRDSSGVQNGQHLDQPATSDGVKNLHHSTSRNNGEIRQNSEPLTHSAPASESRLERLRRLRREGVMQ